MLICVLQVGGVVATVTVPMALFPGEGFGRLDVLRWRPCQDNVPQSKPLPRAKDFDDAALAVQAARKAMEAGEPGYHQSPPLAPI
jgi:hypothetical protein